VAPISDPLATTVTGYCGGGPGRISLAVHPRADGTYRVKVTARGLVTGSRWRAELTGTGRDQIFRDIVAVDGRWKLVTDFPAATNPEEDESFFVYTDELSLAKRFHDCQAYMQPGSSAYGATTCNNLFRFVDLLARDLDDGSTVVRSTVSPAGHGSVWHLTLTATGEASRQVVQYDELASRRDGVLRSRVVIAGVENPRLHLVAANSDRARCRIAVNPANVM
jgi:hypothetical protein